MLGNTVLIDYGIQTEESDLRAHVCPVAARVYVYSTASGLSTIQSGVYKKAPAYTGDIKTAVGYLVPPHRIPGINIISPGIPNWHSYFNRDDSTTRKGDLAVRLVKRLLSDGAIPLKLSSDEIKDFDMQVSGTDILVSAKIKIQVKCDFFGGNKHLGGTGNLFLQIAECNPFRNI